MGKPKKTIEEIQFYFNNQGLQLLDTKYVNCKTNLKYRCLECNYEGEASYNNIRQGSGCRKCARCLITIVDGVYASQHPLYWKWRGMLRRCYSKNSPSYKNYGGRGIKMCRQWRLDFMSFYHWAIATGWNKGLSGHQQTIGRIDNNGNYTPNNCRWESPKQQSNNTRTNRIIELFGESKTVAQWADDPRCVVTYKLFSLRLYQGWIPIAALTTPKRRKKRNKRC